ncbi:MAG: peptidoglycan editing factor PgeF [Chloroflexota bacterium]
MPFRTVNGLRYFIFESLEALGVRHGVFTRHGGVSPSPWESLNVGGSVGDEPERVRENLQRTFTALERFPESRYDVWQVHSNTVVCAEAPYPAPRPPQQADVVLTNRPEVTLILRYADCVPILMYDPEKKVTGLVHAGWQGTVRQASASAVQALQTRYGCQPEDLVVGIGPSIGHDHYPVGAAVVRQVRETFGDASEALLPVKNGRTCFDLWAANLWLLEQAGVRQIELSNICTACHVEDWFSHRAEKGRTGRFGALIYVD